MATIALTVYMASSTQHGMQPIHYAPALALILMMVIWPFANGWRPWKAAPARTCSACGTHWLPGEAGGACPACGQASST